MHGENRSSLPAVLLVAAAAVVLGAMVPARSQLGSRAHTEAILQRLGYDWRGEGPPVILFAVPG
jgi:hypothetical protein